MKKEKREEKSSFDCATTTSRTDGSASQRLVNFWCLRSLWRSRPPAKLVAFSCGLFQLDCPLNSDWTQSRTALNKIQFKRIGNSRQRRNEEKGTRHGARKASQLLSFPREHSLSLSWSFHAPAVHNSLQSRTTFLLAMWSIQANDVLFIYFFLSFLLFQDRLFGAWWIQTGPCAIVDVANLPSTSNHLSYSLIPTCDLCTLTKTR